MGERRPDTSTLLPHSEYDLVIVSFSGGKDSLACLLHLLDLGVPREQIQLWHQDVDGIDGEAFMDWPSTRAYCRAVGESLGVRVLFQGKDGGFRGEMLRDDSPTAGVTFELQSGEIKNAPASKQAKPGTRMQFPQVAADLKVRWCSAYLKIDVAARAITNDPALKEASILYVTGERREESANRAKYATVEAHRTTTKNRRVDQWRPVIEWGESAVWEIIGRYRITPHPAYRLGWGRLSCMACIFGNADQWASVKLVAPEQFATISEFEKSFGKTIHRTRSVEEQADAGEAYKMAPQTIEEAMSEAYDGDIVADAWEMPQGAFGSCGGPS